ESHLSRGRYVSRRIAFNRYKVGEKTGFYSPNLIFHVQNAGVNRGCGAQRINRRHTKLYEQFHFAGIIPVGKDANITAAGNGYTSMERRFKPGALAPGTGSGDRQRRA